MPRLTRHLVTAFTPRDSDAERVLTAIARLRGRIGPAEFAKTLGFTSRYHMARAMKGRDLPNFETLRQWTFVLSWVLAWEENQIPLQELARREQRDPAIYYRLVKRVTGRTWTSLQKAGSAWVIEEIRRRHPPRAPSSMSNRARPARYARTRPER